MSVAAIAWLVRALIRSLGWLRQGCASLVARAARYPWQIACLALLAGSAWLWRNEHEASEQRDAARAQVAALTAASNQAAARALAQRAADEQHYKELANNAEAQHQIRAADADRATAQYLALHRLQPQAAAAPAGAAVAETGSGGAPVPTGAATEPVMVAVSEADLKTCAADYTYARAAYDWALSLED